MAFIRQDYHSHSYLGQETTGQGTDYQEYLEGSVIGKRSICRTYSDHIVHIGCHPLPLQMCVCLGICDFLVDCVIIMVGTI